MPAPYDELAAALRRTHGSRADALATGLSGQVWLHATTGSRLHGFGHPDSDHDQWIVIDQPRTKAAHILQVGFTDTTGRHHDVTVLGLSTATSYAAYGVPQVLDAFWSPQVHQDLLGPMRWQQRPHIASAAHHIRQHCLHVRDERAHDPKQRRHAFRMALNLQSLYRHGFYNPRLNASERTWVQEQAETPVGFEARLDAALALT